MNQYPTHTQRNHRRANDHAQRKQQRTIATQAQAEQSKRWRLDDLLSDAQRNHPNNPALVKVSKGGWAVHGGKAGRGKLIAHTETATLDDALRLAVLVGDAGYHLLGSDILYSA